MVHPLCMTDRLQQQLYCSDSNQGGTLGLTDTVGVMKMTNPVSFSLKFLCGVAYEDNPEGWHEDLITIKAVDKGLSSISKTAARVIHISKNRGIHLGESATYAVIIGI